MNLKNSSLYGIKRKRDIIKLLKLEQFHNINFNTMYHPYIDKQGKERLVEAPFFYLKEIQRRIKYHFDNIEYPENVFSGIKGRSYVDNGLYHIDAIHLIKLDISKFFPNISRERIYNFFYKALDQSPDVAKIMTDLCSVDLNKIKCPQVKQYIKSNKIKYLNHLPSGSPLSCMLSYLVNKEMFDRLTDIANKNNCKVSFYVDDIVFSSKEKIPTKLLNEIISTIGTYGICTNNKKTRIYKKEEFKKITGCIIKNGKLFIPNKTKYKIKERLLNCEFSEKEITTLLGLINSARIFDKGRYVFLLQELTNKQKKSETCDG